MLIKQLDTETVRLINSTQVITSIYSAVKELVENSLDAEAQSIEVNLVNNGLTLIEVKDNGSGIHAQDAQYVGLSSYTSKISNFNDLDLLSTYGFRGEGLNAICQVSDVTVCTKTVNDETMTCYKLNHEGHIVNSELSHGLTGTMVKMHNLFKNMPVRRNILNNKKSINREIKAIDTLLKTYAICKPSVRFMFRVNSNIIFTKPSNKDIFEALKCILGVEVSSKLAYIKKNLSQIEIDLFIPKKDITDCVEISHAGLQFVCVNNRPIKHKVIEKLINKRIAEVFDQNNSNSRKFIFCLRLSIEPSLLDINLEPNKDKIFLQNEATVLSEIDKSLLNFYKLTDSQVPVQNINETINFNSSSSKVNKNNADEVQPVCKKQKINDISEVDENVLNSNNGKPKNMGISENDFIKSISGPILSDSDSNDENDITENNINIKCNKGEALDTEEKDLRTDESELFDFAQDVLKENNCKIIEETASELPYVNLGEDFDLNSIITSANNNTSVDKQATDVAWSKGQISGLQNGVSIVNSKIKSDSNRKYENEEKQADDIELFDFDSEVKPTNVNKELISDDDTPTLPITELDRKMSDKKLKTGSTKKVNSRLNAMHVEDDPTQTKIPFAGEDSYIQSGPSAYAAYCTVTRAQIFKEHPEFSPAEIATCMNKRWKEISPEERQYYRDIANQENQNKSNNTPISQPFKKSKHAPSQDEKDKNRKQLISMLKNMKAKKAEIRNESMIMRSFKTWNIDMSLVKKHFNLPVKQREKSIVGSLNSLIWIINMTENLFAFDVTELQAQLGIKAFDVAQIDEKSVENLIDQWFKIKNDMSVFHQIHSLEK